jgi:DNA recombination protein RmuC
MVIVGVLLVGLAVGLVIGGCIGALWSRHRSALTALAEARVTGAQDAAAADRAAREQALAAMVVPMREALDRVQAQLHASERDRLSASAALQEHLSAMRHTTDGLRIETADLVTALRAPQVRGRWGELQLERTVEASGMVEHIDYDTQVSTATPDGTLRPDLVVKLVGGRRVVVDAKVAFAGYLQAMEARSEKVRAERLQAHARQLRAHVDALGAKAYWERFEQSPEFVVCFVPADAFLDAALRVDPDLLEHALRRNVVIATPTTLVALLRTIGHTWRQQALERNAAEVGRLGRQLYQRLSGMAAHLDKLGRSLNNAVGTYNTTVGALEGRVLVTARRLADLSVADRTVDGRLDEPEQVLTVSRSLTAAELTGRVP